MQGRDFLDLAREAEKGKTEAHWRGAVVHAYYALMLECRDALAAWGRTAPPRDNIHTFVRLTLQFAKDADLKRLSDALDRLVRARNHASYNMAPGILFQDATRAQLLVQIAADALALLDQIEADPARHAAAIAALPPPPP